MRNRAVWIGSIALGTALASPVAADPVDRPGAIAGQVVATKGGEEGRLVPRTGFAAIENRQRLKDGDILRTNRSGTMSILFADRTQVRLGRNATMAVGRSTAGGAQEVSLRRGKAWGRSPRKNSRLRVRTATATAAIRGTEWAIEAAEDVTRLQVFEGEVELANEFGSVTVAGGEAAIARRGAAPIKVALVNPDGREQMLYFLQLEDGLDLMRAGAGAGAAVTALAKGEWEVARNYFVGLASSPQPAERAIAEFGLFVVAAQLGEAPRLPPQRGTPQAVLGHALILAYQGDLRPAITRLDDGLLRYPGDIGLLKAKARVAILLGEPELAREAIDIALASHPDAPDVLAFDAEIAADYEGNPTAALATIKRAAALAPDDPAVLKMHAQIWRAKRGQSEARRAVERALALRPLDASLHALRAEILLAQNELAQARAAIDRALELEPDLAVIRRLLAQYHLRKGQAELALGEALASSAANPSYGRGFIDLAEISYATGRSEVAAQQLDAADRLDPFGPSTPLARTAIALHRFDADGAIEGARAALQRMQTKGGEYANISENQKSGSLVSRSFRFLELEAQGRYYADRAFDTFSAVSYPDQFLNRSPSPFLQRALDGSFDAFGGEDDAFISSLFQGAVLEPLSIANPSRTLLLSHRDFFELELSGGYLTEELRERRAAGAAIDGIVNGGVPFAFSITADWSDFSDAPAQLALSPLLDGRGFDERSIDAAIGFELTPRDNVVFLADYFKESVFSDTGEALQQELGRPDFRYPTYGDSDESASAAVLWNHELGYRNQLTLGGLYLTGSNFNFFDNSEFEQLLLEESDPSFFLLTANHAVTVWDIDLRTGAEYSQLDLPIRSAELLVPQPGSPSQDEELLFQDLFSYRLSEWRIYADMRREFGDALLLQGQLALRKADEEVLRAENLQGPIPAGALLSERDLTLDIQIGAGWQPASGHWLRAAYFDTSTGLKPFTFAPIAAAGLRGLIAPTALASQTRSTIARWDAEWSDWFFTALEYQRQVYSALEYTVADTGLSVEGQDATLDWVGLEANVLLGGDIGVRAAVAWSDARARAPYVAGANAVVTGFTTNFAAGDRLPFVPEMTGQVALAWAIPAPLRLRARLKGDYIGPQVGDNAVRMGDYIVVSALAEWEPFDRLLRIEAGVRNLFNAEYDDTPGLKGPGRTFRVAASLRF